MAYINIEIDDKYLWAGTCMTKVNNCFALVLSVTVPAFDVICYI